MDRRRFLKYAAGGAIAGLAAGYGLRDILDRLTPVQLPTTTTQTVTETATRPLSCSASLRELAQARGLLIGSAAFPEGITAFREASELQTYTSVLAREFDYLIPENHMKWPYIHPTADSWYFSEADKEVSFASDHQMRIRGGPLIWPVDQYGLPSGEMNQMRAMSTSEFRQLVHEHITNLVGHYKGKVRDWYVLGEAVDDQEGLRNSLFLEKLGEGYVGEVFQVAREADPSALLTYDDYGAEGLNEKSDRVYSLLKKLISDGVPIDEVGLEMHVGWDLTGDPKAEEIAANVKRLAGLGLKVGITQMDVQIRKLPGSLQERLETERKTYHDIIAACLKERNFTDIMFWGFTDKYTWIDDYFGPDDPLLFDRNYQPKPAYWGVMDALLNR